MLTMDPHAVFCPNLHCPARGQVGRGNIGVHSRKERRFICHQCQKTFAQSKATPLYRLHKPVELFVTVITLLAHGCPVQAIVAAFGLDERTVASWQTRAGHHGQTVHEHLVEQPRELGQVQADEIRVKRQGAVVWIAMAMSVATRLWLGAAVSEHRDLPLITKLINRVRRGAGKTAMLFCTDGLASYVTAILQVFRDPVRQRKRGRPRLKVWQNLMIAQAVKRYQCRRVVKVVRRVKRGAKRKVEQMIRHTQGAGVINTAFIERINGTFRERLCALVRRGRALARQTLTLHRGVYLIGTIYNFCTIHESLCRDGVRLTPAMAAGISQHCWSVQELMSYRVPLPRWTPPKRRGRRSKELLRKIQKWCT
jgi:transposase-like protein